MIDAIKDMLKYVVRPPKDEEEGTQYFIMGLIFLGAAIVCFLIGVGRLFTLRML